MFIERYLFDLCLKTISFIKKKCLFRKTEVRAKKSTVFMKKDLKTKITIKSSQMEFNYLITPFYLI